MEINHHGYLLTGDVEKAAGRAFEMAAKILDCEEGELSAHPDFSFFNSLVGGTSFTINDARSVRERSSKRSFKGKGRVFVIRANAFTREAGNALLKTIEEPAGVVYFFIITGLPENLLDTLRSRLVPLAFYPNLSLPKEKQEFVQKFLGLSSDKRMEMISKITNDKKKTMEFLNSLEILFRKKLIKNSSKDIITAIDNIDRQKDFLRGRASSSKMILEHLSLTLPRL